MGAISGNLACAPPPREQPPGGPHHRAAPSRSAHGVPSDGHWPVGHQRYRNWSYRGLENLGFRRFWRFWPKSTLSGPMPTQFPYRWWPTDTGPPEGIPGTARDGAKQRRGAGWLRTSWRGRRTYIGQLALDLKRAGNCARSDVNVF